MQRSEGLDLIRAFAIFTVILIHCLRCILPFDSMDIFNSTTTIEKIFYFTSYTIGSIGVPLFFLLTGYLLLCREFKSPIEFYKRNLLPILITWEIWILPNNWLATYYYDVTFHWSTVIKNMLFIEPVFIGHSWYMPVIIGIYLFIPLIAKTLQNLSYKDFFIPILISYAYLFLLPSLNMIFNKHWQFVLDLNFSGGLYGFYVIVGYLMHRIKINRSMKMIQLMIILIAITTYLQILIHQSTGNIFHLWYDFFTLPLIAILIFIMIHDIKIKLPLIENISRCSFGMYLVHVFYIGVILKVGLIDLITINELKVITLSIIVYLLSFVSISIIKKIPLIGKILVR